MLQVASFIYFSWSAEARTIHFQFSQQLPHPTTRMCRFSCLNLRILVLSFASSPFFHSATLLSITNFRNPPKQIHSVPPFMRLFKNFASPLCILHRSFPPPRRFSSSTFSQLAVGSRTQKRERSFEMINIIVL